MAAWTGWADDVLTRAGWPLTLGNRNFLNTWQTYEQSKCRNNPLGTIVVMRGSTNCNTFTSGGVVYHVQNYTSHAQGATATVNTMRNGRYPYLVAALHSGDPFAYPNPQGVAANIRTWGTSNFAAWYLLHAGSFAGGGSTGGGTATGLPSPPTPGTRASKAWRDMLRALDSTVPAKLRATARTRARILHR